MLVHSTGFFIEFTCEDTVSTKLLKGMMKTTNAGKQVDESE
jgi:hypothetical protein